MKAAPMKKAARGYRTTTMTASLCATNFIAVGAGQESAGAFFRAKPHVGIGMRNYCAEGVVLQSFSVLENTIEVAGNLPESEVFSRPEFGNACFSHLHGYGRDGLVRKAGRMATSMFSTSRPPVALEKAAGGLQSQVGAEAMTNLVNTTPTPKLGTLTLGNKPATSPAPIARAQAIREALGAAAYWLDAPHEQRVWLATAHARRALSLLKQACNEIREGGKP